MLRAFGTFGLAGIFLAISPRLRASVLEQLSLAVATLQAHAPWSYVALGLASLIVFAITLSRGSVPR